MKFTINARTFAQAVAWAARALPRNPHLPVLAGLRLEATNGQVTVSGFDYETCTHATHAAEVHEEGTVLVSGRILTDITSRLPDAELQVTAGPAQAELSCRKARFTLLTLPMEDYPSLPKMPEAIGRLDAKAFTHAAAQTVIAAGEDDTVPMLTAVCIDFSDESGTAALRLAATDNYRLAARQIAWEPVLEATPVRIVVPHRAIGVIIRTMAEDDMLTLGLARAADDTVHSLGVQVGGRQFITRLLDSEYVNVTRAIPGSFTSHARMDTAQAIDAVRRVGVTAERLTPVQLTFAPGDPGELTLAAGSGDTVTGTDAIPASFDGEEPLTICFRPAYLLDALNALGSDTAHLAFTTATKAALLTPDHADDAELAYRHVMMPVRLADAPPKAA